MFKILIVVVLTSFFGIVPQVQAVEYYAIPNGSGNICSQSNPCKIQEALSHMSGGDILYLTQGVYTEYYQNYEKWAIINIDNFFSFNNPLPTLENPIIIKPVDGADVKILGDGINDICVEIESENNIIIEGINFEKCSIRIGNNGEANNVIIRNNNFLNHNAGDNIGAVIASNCRDITIENNIIVGPGLGGNGVHLNTNGLYISRNLPNLKVLYNEISNVPIGIYYKHANTQEDLNMEIAYNYIHNTDRNAAQFNSNYAYIHDNLFGKNNASVSVDEANGVPGGDYNRFMHNTFYNCSLNLNAQTQSGDPLPYAVGNVLKDNLFFDNNSIPLKIWTYYTGEENHLTELDYNLYHSGDVEIISEYSQEYSLDNWKTYYGQDQHSISIEPIFNVNNDFNEIDDFKLVLSSPGYQAASDNKDIGADISQVGIQGVEQEIRADTNQDNQITSTDAMLTLRKSLNLDMSQTNWQDSPTTGDVNCDNSITTADALLLLRQSVGLDMSNTDWCVN